MATRSSRYLQIVAYLMIAAIFVFIMGITHNCGRLKSSPLEGNSGGDTVDIAILYGPGSYYFHSDSLAGINFDVAQKFSEETGTPVKVWPITDPASGMAKVEKGTFDILASLPLDNYIKKRFPVSESIFLDRLVLIQLADSMTGKKRINSSLDLNGKEVYVTAGSSGIQRIKNLGDEIGGKIEVMEMPDLSDELLTLKVANGSIPLAMVNEKVAQKVAESYRNLSYDSTVSFTQFQVWVFSPSDSVTSQKFNSWFDIYRKSDSYRSLINSY